MRILLNFHANTDSGVMSRIVLRTFIHFNASEEPPHAIAFRSVLCAICSLSRKNHFFICISLSSETVAHTSCAIILSLI
jgi:hypothetical protein